ncbi:hypothetical protein [Streptomyces sp. NPDC059072]|uniref:hypothetical protein n=1 Tax=Streptomyces sp. NPDC059072 TaxID=3346715 RepID=UPI003697CF71
MSPKSITRCTRIPPPHLARDPDRTAVRGGRLAVVDLEPGASAASPSGAVARTYLASFTAPDGSTVSRSGTDTLRVVDGLITEVWSVSSGAAGRTFYR